MAHINKKDFSIISDYINIDNLETDSDDYFECDDMIAPTISLLNKKGYKTAFCCAGHPFPCIDNVGIDHNLTAEEIEENNIEVLLITDMTDELIEKYGFDDPEISKCPYYMEHKNPFTQLIYIYFEGEYEFADIPEDAYIDECGLYIHYTDEEFCPDGFKGIMQVYETNKKLYEWAERLPDLNKEN